MSDHKPQTWELRYSERHGYRFIDRLEGGEWFTFCILQDCHEEDAELLASLPDALNALEYCRKVLEAPEHPQFNLRRLMAANMARDALGLDSAADGAAQGAVGAADGAQ